MFFSVCRAFPHLPVPIFSYFPFKFHFCSNLMRISSVLFVFVCHSASTMFISPTSSALPLSFYGNNQCSCKLTSQFSNQQLAINSQQSVNQSDDRDKQTQRVLHGVAELCRRVGIHFYFLFFSSSRLYPPNPSAIAQFQSTGLSPTLPHSAFEQCNSIPFCNAIIIKNGAFDCLRREFSKERYH